jgi:hypothetical protein
MAQLSPPVPVRHRSERSDSHERTFRTLAVIASIALLVPAVAVAQTGGVDAGSALWGAFRAVLYGPWGLVGSAVVVGIGIYMFLERGFMHALGVMAAGALLFFVPLIVISMRNAAQAMGGAG